MKLIYCPNCKDVVRLFFYKRRCHCKQSWGRYKGDGVNAIIGGQAIPMAIGWASFIDALAIQEENNIKSPDEFLGANFISWIIPENSDHVSRK